VTVRQLDFRHTSALVAAAIMTALIRHCPCPCFHVSVSVPAFSGVFFPDAHALESVQKSGKDKSSRPLLFRTKKFPFRVLKFVFYFYPPKHVSKIEILFYFFPVRFG